MIFALAALPPPSAVRLRLTVELFIFNRGYASGMEA
jgi:hypothetical protein